jgi:hypothetical protein
MIKNWKSLSVGLLLSGALAFAGCTKGLVEGSEDDGSTETHVAGESTSSSVSTSTTSGLIEEVDSLDATLTGIVVDDLGFPLSGVSVGAYGQTTSTNELGLWVLDSVPVSGVDATALAGAFGTGTNAALTTVPVSFNGGTGYTTAVTFVGTNAVVTDSGAGSAGTSNSPNTVIISGLTGDSGSVVLKRNVGTVQGVLRDAATQRPVSDATMVLVPTDNQIGNIATNNAAGAAAGNQIPGNTVYGYREASLVTTTDANGSYEFGNIAVASSYNLYVSSTTVSALSNSADGSTGVGGAVIGNDSGGTGSFTTCTAASNCLTANSGALAVGGGITVVPTSISVVDADNAFGTDNTDSKGPYVKRVFDAFVHSRTDANNSVELNSGIDLFSEPLILQFSETIRNADEQTGAAEFDIVESTTGEVLSVVISNQATGAQYTVDSTKTALSGDTLTLYTTEAISENVLLAVRLKRDDFKDLNGNDLNTVQFGLINTNNYNALAQACAGLQPRDTSVSSSDTTNICLSATATGLNPLTQVTQTANYFTYNIYTFNEPSTVAPATALAQVSPGTQLSGASSFHSYTGLNTYASGVVPSTSTTTATTNGTVYSPAALASTVFTYNLGATAINTAISSTVNRLEALANRLFNASRHNVPLTYQVARQAAALTVDTVSGASYVVQAFDSSGVNQTANAQIYAGRSTTAANSAAFDKLNVTSGTTGISRAAFTGTGSAQKLLLDFGTSAGSNYSVSVTPQNEFGDLLTSQAISVTLADNAGPMAALQNVGDGKTLTSNTLDVMTKAGGSINTNISDATGEQQDTVQSEELFPTLEIGASLYLSRNRSTGASGATVPLLANTSDNKTYAADLSSNAYTSADYASWEAAGLSRSILVSMTEAMSTSVSAATVTANSATGSVLKASTGLTALSAISTSSTPAYMLATLGDFKRMLNLSFFAVEGLTDATGNAAASDTGVILLDKVPPLATEVSVYAGSAVIKMNQPFAVGSNAASFNGSFWMTGAISANTANALNIAQPALATTMDYAPIPYSTAGITTFLTKSVNGVTTSNREHFQFLVESFTTTSLTAPTASGKVFKIRSGSSATLAYHDAKRQNNGSTAATNALSSSRQYLDATYTITNDLTNWNGTMVVTLSSSSTNIDTNAFFSELSVAGTASTYENASAFAFFPNAVDESLNSWATLAVESSTHNDYYYCADANNCSVPAIVVQDKLAPRLRAIANDTVRSITPGAQEVGLTNVYLDIASTNGTLLNSSTTPNTGDNNWQINEGSGGNGFYLRFRENIDCSSCTTGTNNTSRYTNISVAHSGADLDTLIVKFTQTGTAVENDAITISGVKDFAGNTTGVITVALDDTSGGGIEISPSTIAF